MLLSTIKDKTKTAIKNNYRARLFFRDVYKHRGPIGSLGALGRRVVGSVISDDLSYRLTCQNMTGSGSLDEIVSAAYTLKGWGPYWYITPIQTRPELRKLSRTASSIDPDVVMEIGSMHGGTFFVWCRYFDSDTYISLDISNPVYEKKKRLFESFTDEVRDSLAGDEIDFLFIDGDHSYDGVKSDFEMYSEFMSDGGIIAFDDIYKDSCGVARFWEEVSASYETEEFAGGGSGIGILYT
jgi:hypothetical protein